MEGEANEPLEGLFAVRFGKNWPERAMSVQLIDAKHWTVVLDGQTLGVNTEWPLAFGHIAKTSRMLLGRRIDTEEYTRLMTARRADILAGVDLTKPINHNNGKPPF